MTRTLAAGYPLSSKHFTWEPSVARAHEAVDWMVRQGFAEVYALRAVGDQVGLNVAQMRVLLAGGRP